MFVHLRPASAAVVALVISLSGCKSAPPADAAAVVNGRVITFAELEKQYLIQYPNGPTNPKDDQTQINKLDLMRQLIDAKIMFQRAEQASLLAVDADVEAKLAEMKAPYSQEEFNKQLANRKMGLDDLKAQLRQELSIQKLINKEITANINISDGEVQQFFAENKARFNLPEPQIHIAQILVSPRPDPNLRNLKNDKAQNDAEATKKIQMLEARLRQGEDFSMLAQNYSEDTNTVTNGGDLGFLPESTFEQAAPELRKMVMSMQPNQLSGIIKTNDSYRILKVLSKEPAGQRELSDPRVQQDIRERLMTRKDQLLKQAYYEAARNEGKVENYLATRVVESMSKKK